jgi:uncharacterized protein
MKLHLTQAAGNQLITGYGDGWVAVNTVRYDRSLIVLPERVIEDWDGIDSKGLDFDSLTVAHFERIAELKPEVVLLGTGKTHRFIHPRLTAPLTAMGVSVECMDTAAACRTYNILMAEGRQVAAGLIL